MKESNIFKPTLKFSQKTSVLIFVLFVYDMYIVVDSLVRKFFYRFVFLNKSSYKKIINIFLFCMIYRHMKSVKILF